MRKILLTIGLFTSLVAQANVVKPPTTGTAARGTTVINGVEFDYSVADNGWRTEAHVYPVYDFVQATKDFRLDFESKTNGLDLTMFEASLLSDATAKCAELGSIEYPDQAKNIPATLTPKLETTIVNRRSGDYAGRISGVYVCQVVITGTAK